MLEGRLLISDFLMVLARESMDVKRHVPCDGTTTFRVHDGVTAFGSLYEFGILFLEDGKVALRLPIPDRVGSEEQVHLFKRALVGFRIQSPDNRDGDGVDGAEDVVCLFVEGTEDDGQ